MIMPSNFYNQYCSEFKSLIASALKEDIQSGDHTSKSCIAPNSQSTAVLWAKEKGIIAGLELAEKIFNYYDPKLQFNPLINEGAEINEGMRVFTIQGNTQSLLATERLVLNTLQRMSGIATYTNQLNKAINHTSCKLLDTRKTTPNFRYPEKWAVYIGGGTNHRMGLFDALMIKDNHIDFCGGVTQALKRTQAYLKQLGKALEVVVECRNPQEIQETLSFEFVSRILLDNHNLKELKEALKLIDGKKPTEASGNITENNLVAVAETGVDFISMGALTYAAKSIDLSLKAG